VSNSLKVKTDSIWFLEYQPRKNTVDCAKPVPNTDEFTCINTTRKLDFSS